jgi:hypothetical protein
MFGAVCRSQEAPNYEAKSACGLDIPNERDETGRRPRKGWSRRVLPEKPYLAHALHAAPHGLRAPLQVGHALPATLRPSAVVKATVARVVPHDLRLLRLRRALPRVIQRLPNRLTCLFFFGKINDGKGLCCATGGCHVGSEMS